MSRVPPDRLVMRLLGRAADHIEPLAVWPERATYRATIGAEQFCVKESDAPRWIAREVDGHRRAGTGGIPVPELVAVDELALAMRWVPGVSLNERKTPAPWRAAGAVMHAIHALPAEPPWGDGLGDGADTWRAFFEQECESELAGCIAEHDFDRTQASRIRAAIDDARADLDDPVPVWCHGDLQPDHILFHLDTDEVVAVIDWSDHALGDARWDLAILTLDNSNATADVLDGYGADGQLRERLQRALPLYRVVRWLGETRWLADRNLDYSASLTGATVSRFEPRTTEARRSADSAGE